MLQIDGAYDLPDEESEDEEENGELLNDQENEINEDVQLNETYARFLLTNARSVIPKIDSLKDAFASLRLHFACVTETWYKGGAALADHIVDVEGASGIRILHKSRDGRVKKRGGGVAIAFDTAICNFKQRHMKTGAKDFEIVCATGKIGKIDRRFVVFAVYVPPDIKAARFRVLEEALAAEISAVKSSIKDPVVIVGGDFNHRDITGAVGLAEPITLVQTGPTRGNSTIDLVYTNVPASVREARVLPPLESTTGNQSDHKCVYVAAEFPAVRKFHWEIKMRRLRNLEREKAFEKDLSEWDWNRLEEKDDVDDMWNEIREAINTLTERHFPLVRVRKRSNESPWITRGIRRLWKKKIRIYKKEGRSRAWWNIDEVLQKRIEDSRNDFVERVLAEGNSGRSFYAATKKLAKAAVVPQWSVKDLFVGREPKGICRDVLDYFGRIAAEPSPPVEGVQRCSGGLPAFTLERTEALLKNAKKTDSRVDGDPLPHLVRRHPAAFATPIAAVYNRINDTGTWPASWKTEHLTIIPKNPNPADLSECRNISCTSIFSKILEGEVLKQLREELLPDPAQYGGIKKCSVEHMLIDLWEDILEALEGGTNASVLLGVDYEKAFNRMRHDVCLEQLRSLGASPGSRSLVRAFLEGRTMTIKVDGQTVDPILITRGSPQGSVLGCLLYCITTQRLTMRLRHRNNGVQPESIRFFPGDSSDDEAVNFWDQEDIGQRPAAYLYVDDTTLVDAVPLIEATKHFTTGPAEEVFESLELGADFDRLGRRAEDIGMRINAKKTQLLVISPRNGYVSTALIPQGRSEPIKSVENMKLVGFMFGSSPGAGPQVDYICEQYKQKKWMLYHLRSAGIKGGQLFRLYCCYVRSAIEYCSVVYHAMLTQGQEERLESIQRHAVRICFGGERPAAQLMAENGVETLKARRVRRFDTFTRKAWSNPRFGPKWFPPRDPVPWAIRHRRGIQEPIAATQRRFNSPLAQMKRRANEMRLTEA